MIKKMEGSIPLTADGKPDIAAILKLNGITNVDLSAVKVINASDTTDVQQIISAAKTTNEKD